MLDIITALAQSVPPLAPTPVAGNDWLVSYYAHARTALAAGSFSACALSVSIASFVFAKVKESVYDSESYAELVRANRAFNKGYSANGALRRWFVVLALSVAVSFVSFLAQMSLGFVGERWAVIVCVALLVAACVMLAAVMVTTYFNVMAWIRWSATRAERKIGEASSRPSPR
jgi:hypothetical protein